MNNILDDKITTLLGALLAGLVAVQAAPDANFPSWASLGLAFAIALLGALTKRK